MKLQQINKEENVGSYSMGKVKILNIEELDAQLNGAADKQKKEQKSDDEAPAKDSGVEKEKQSQSQSQTILPSMEEIKANDKNLESKQLKNNPEVVSDILPEDSNNKS